VVPFATPDRPPEAVHTIEVTPTLSEAVPDIFAVAVEVEKIVVAGKRSLRIGADLSEEAVDSVGGTAGGC
jgi:hypothetical protein